jgi:hypothetical protein
MRVTQTAISVQAKTGPRLYAGAFAACLIVSSSRVVACSKQLAMTGAAVKEMSVDARASDTEKEAGNGRRGGLGWRRRRREAAELGEEAEGEADSCDLLQHVSHVGVSLHVSSL